MLYITAGVLSTSVVPVPHKEVVYIYGLMHQVFYVDGSNL